jgi:hypothetical protein
MMLLLVLANEGAPIISASTWDKSLASRVSSAAEQVVSMAQFDVTRPMESSSSSLSFVRLVTVATAVGRWKWRSSEDAPVNQKSERDAKSFMVIVRTNEREKKRE